MKHYFRLMLVTILLTPNPSFGNVENVENKDIQKETETPHMQETTNANQKTRKERINQAFNELRKDNLHILDNFYHPNLKFSDPLGDINGLKQMKAYYANLYETVKDINFDFKVMSEEGDNIMAPWVMTLSAEGLNGGEPIQVTGISHITFDPKTNLVIYHRDYFDMGEFIYEHIPVLASIIRMVKRKLAH